MTNREKYDYAFLSNFKVKKEELEGLKYQQLFEWDSVGHMDLIADLESAFGIQMEMKDVLDLSAYTKGDEILAKYGVDLNA